LVEGVVSRVAQFGAFVSLEPGIEALLHASQISDPAPTDPTVVLRDGQHLMMRVISIEADKQRLGLSLKEVTDEEKQRWQERQQPVQEAETEVESEAETGVDEAVPVQ
jgi:ribosomal protein S1